jgi:hypothetical protein
MTTLSKSSFVLAIALATSGLCVAHADTAPRPKHATVPSVAHDMTKAKALAPLEFMPPMRADHRPETDGLSRNVDECNYGCIDN